MEIVFATGNRHKAAEIATMLPAGYHLKSLADLGFTEDIPETGNTLEANAALKARRIYSEFGLPVFADDTGLEVRALNGRPGVYSARYAGENATYEDNCSLLLKEMHGIADREAAFRTVICFIDSQGREQFVEGTVQGQITAKPSGTNGFGYDPVFRPQGFDKTFAEMDIAEKNAISHRALALKKLMSLLSGLPSL